MKGVLNWALAGMSLFILKILSLISNGIRPIVDMVIGTDRRLIKGCVIHTMRELEEMDNDDCY